mmetsp:Transcript_10777/g.20309  ORF Transcript_10777/g.20309 Transcript_10777/m.20309 type:complete len:299 (-) Transcript_10777:490-1386(-)
MSFAEVLPRLPAPPCAPAWADIEALACDFGSTLNFASMFMARMLCARSRNFLRASPGSAVFFDESFLSVRRFVFLSRVILAAPSSSAGSSPSFSVPPHEVLEPYRPSAGLSYSSSDSDQDSDSEVSSSEPSSSSMDGCAAALNACSASSIVVFVPGLLAAFVTLNTGLAAILRLRSRFFLSCSASVMAFMEGDTMDPPPMDPTTPPPTGAITPPPMLAPYPKGEGLLPPNGAGDTVADDGTETVMWNMSGEGTPENPRAKRNGVGEGGMGLGPVPVRSAPSCDAAAGTPTRPCATPPV